MPSPDRMTHHPDTRLPQRVALGVLLRSFPPAQVDRVLDAADRREQRQRLLPARLMVYFTLGMWIFKALSYELILAELLLDAPGLALSVPAEETATAAAIGRARRRLGVEPLRLLFEQAAGPSAEPAPAAFHGLRPVRLSQVEVGVPATPANLLGFGTVSGPGPCCEPGPGTALTRLPLPPAPRPGRSVVQARLSVLVEQATGRVAAAEVTGGADPLPDRLLSGAALDGALLIMDERMPCARLWTAAERRGAERLWPLAEPPQPAAATRLPDGSQLGKLTADDGSQLSVRVLPRAGGRGWLATSVTDHRAAPAAELAALYDGPRAADPGLAGIGGYAEGARLELRSKDPEMVRQEIYAMLCVHHAIGDLIGPPR
jgi:hypothetical protein